MSEEKKNLEQYVDEHLSRRRFAPKTRASYAYWIFRLTEFFGKYFLNDFTIEDIAEFIKDLDEKEGLSPSTIKQATNSLHFFFNTLAKQNWEIRKLRNKSIKRKSQYVPTQKEVLSIIDAISSEQTQLAVALIYSLGLNLEDVINLRKVDIDFENNIIHVPIKQKKMLRKAPDVYEQYILYYSKLKHPHYCSLLVLRRVLSAFNDYLEKKRICLSKLRIEDIDTFLIEYNRSYALKTRGGHRSYLRGFLKYLYQIRGIVHKDFAPLLVGAPVYAQAKPPKFLRPQEVQRIFAGLKLSSARGLRSYAMLLFIFTLGLRPKEISLISLDDILFSKGQVGVKDRKATNPIILPLPDITIKAIAAYLVGARPKSTQRTLFLRHRAPYSPISPAAVSMDIKSCMRKANLTSSAYWLRHTYAQNLLERGTSIFEIKEMMGHDRIQTSQRYIHIHTKLMREVLFNETL